MPRRSVLHALCILTVVTVGCAVAPATESPSDEDLAALPPAEVDDPESAWEYDAESGMITCRVPASSLGIVVGSVAVTMGCTAPAGIAGSLSCSAPYGALGIIAAGVYTASLQTQVQCGPRTFFRDTRVPYTVRETTGHNCTVDEALRRERSYREVCTADVTLVSLRCADASGTCGISGAEARARAERGRTCRDRLKFAQSCYRDGDVRFAEQQRMIATANRNQRACDACVQPPPPPPPPPGDCEARKTELCTPEPGVGRKITTLYHGDSACGPAYGPGLPRVRACFGMTDCNEIRALIRRSARCYVGRRLSADLCHGGSVDANHQGPMDDANRLFGNCYERYRTLQCENPENVTLHRLTQNDRRNYYCR
jgi:hypothetical protein